MTFSVGQPYVTMKLGNAWIDMDDIFMKRLQSQ